MRYPFVVAALTLWLSISNADSEWTISAQGYGPIRIGMTIEKVEAILGTKLLPSNEENRPIQIDCDDVFPAKGLNHIGFMIIDGHIASVETGYKNVSTDEGIRVGDSAEKVRKIYGARLAIEDHHYQEGAFYYFVWVKKGQSGIKYVIDAEGKVVQIEAGGPAIMLVEGCS